MSETDKEALRLLNERMCAKVNDGRTILAENVADMLIAIRDLAAERDALQARVAELEGALQRIERVPALSHLRGHLAECAWCTDSAKIARQALKENQDD